MKSVHCKPVGSGMLLRLRFNAAGAISEFCSQQLGLFTKLGHLNRAFRMSYAYDYALLFRRLGLDAKEFPRSLFA